MFTDKVSCLYRLEISNNALQKFSIWRINDIFLLRNLILFVGFIIIIIIVIVRSNPLISLGFRFGEIIIMRVR
mgnify:CR=1 FL=1